MLTCAFAHGCTRLCAGPTGVADNAQLFHLNEANLLSNLSLRYSADAIYTYTGTVLLALNPNKRIAGLYDDDLMNVYRGRALGVLPPHVYAIAERARRAIATHKTDQSIVVSGESGAGKTESCRAIVQYLAHHSRHEASSLTSALLAANPVLEAFGCAQTTRNKNSSRFGKLMKIWTSEDSLALSASSMVTYLLEKARVSHLAPGERNFHAFYYLAAATATASEESRLCSCSALGWLRKAAVGRRAFRFLHPVEVQPTSAEQLAAFAQQYLEVDLALASLGASETEAAEAWGLLGAVLALGEIELMEVSKLTDEITTTDLASSPPAAAVMATADEGGQASVPEASQPALRAAAACLGVQAVTLEVRLLTRTVVSPRGSSFVIRRGVPAAQSCRDGLAHELYDRLFKWVVAVVNRSLAGDDVGLKAAAPLNGSRSIAILDIFGFEAMEVNSLEQLLINHTNERLQLYFLHQTLHAELALYLAEGIPAPSIALADNTACVNLIDGKPDGLIWLLEDECDLQRRAKADAVNPSDANLVERAFTTHASHAHLAKPSRPAEKVAVAAGSKGLRARTLSPPRFAILHFAGTVDYDSCGLVAKNSDALHAELPMLLSASVTPLVAKLFGVDEATADGSVDSRSVTTPAEGVPPPPPKPRGRGRGKGDGKGKLRGVAGSFSRQLDSLMSMLEQTTPHYVRCVKPNSKQQPALLEEPLVLHQLRCGGTPQLLTLMGRGYPTRVDFEALAARYRPLLPVLGCSTSARDFVQALLASLALSEATSEGGGDFAMGVRRVFFSAGAMATLDKLMHGTDDELVAVVSKIHSFLRRKRWQQMIAATRACNRIGQRVVARRQLGRLALRARALIVIKVTAVQRWAVRAVVAVRAKHAAIALQAVIRGNMLRTMLARRRMAVAVVQGRARLIARRKMRMLQQAAELYAAVVIQAAARKLAAGRVAAEQVAEVATKEERLVLRRATAAASAAQRLTSAARGTLARRHAAVRRSQVAVEAAARDMHQVAVRAQREAMRTAKAEKLAATRLQCAVRLVLAARVLAVKRADALRKKQAAAAARKERAKQVQRQLAALMLQCAVRGAQARGRLALKRASICGKKQARLYEARKEWQRKIASTSLQCAWRTNRAYAKVAVERASAREHAACERHTRATLALRAASKASAGPGGAMSLEMIQMIAAMRLQGRWRKVCMQRLEKVCEHGADPHVACHSRGLGMRDLGVSSCCRGAHAFPFLLLSILAPFHSCSSPSLLLSISAPLHLRSSPFSCLSATARP